MGGADAGRTVWRITYNLEKTLLCKFLFLWSNQILIGRAKRAPHCGVQSRFRVIYYMCQFLCLGMPNCVGGITWPKNAHAHFWAVKNDLRHPC